MRIPLATTLKTRTGAPDKDARLKNCYVEVKGDQPIVRKRPSAQGGIATGTGTAQGGIGLNINGVPYFIGFWADTMQAYNGSGANWTNGSTYPTGGSGPDLPAYTYATFNPATKGANVTLSNGNLTVSITSSSSDQIAKSTIFKTSGKWYWEVTASNVGDENAQIKIGIGDETTFRYILYAPSVYICGGGSQSYKQTSSAGSGCFGSSFNNGAIIGIALDMDNLSISVYINGASQGVMFSGLPASFYASVGVAIDSPVVAPIICTANFGATPFAYSVPSGYNSGLYT